MHEDVVRRVSDVQERLESLLPLQRGVLPQCARAKPILNDLAMFTEFGSALEMHQDIPPTHPISRQRDQNRGYTRGGTSPHITQHDQGRTTGIDHTSLLQEVPRSRKGVEDQNRLVEDAQIVDVAFNWPR
jgi:hypothetical protein